MSFHKFAANLFGVVVAVLMLPAASAASPGDVATAYDGHDTVAVPAAPYASTAPFTTTVTYDSSAFATSASERDVNGTSDSIFTNMTGCAAAPPYWGGRSGWLRFDSAVSGSLRVDVTTTGYDPILTVWNAPSAPLGTTQFVNMLNQDCNGVRADSQESLSGLAVQANRPIHVETLGFCDRASYWTSAPGCTDGPPFDDLDTKSPGGQTSVSLTFQCTNTDGDDFCESLDGCPSRVGAQSGCPDLDRDGVLDEADRCQTIPGTDADGCPPDQDGDGIVNASDKCVNQKGYAPSGCPDGDSDTVYYPADSCPTVKGIAPDGCPDGDGDGVSDRSDACAAVFGLTNGCPGPLRAIIRWGFVRGTYRLQRLRVETLEGATIEVRCSSLKKSRCPFPKRTVLAGKKPTNFASAFRNRSLRARPFTLTFRVTKRGYLGTYKRYSYNGRTAPKFPVDRCIQPDGKLSKCPA